MKCVSFQTVSRNLQDVNYKFRSLAFVINDEKIKVCCFRRQRYPPFQVGMISVLDVSSYWDWIMNYTAIVHGDVQHLLKPKRTLNAYSFLRKHVSKRERAYILSTTCKQLQFYRCMGSIKGYVTKWIHSIDGKLLHGQQGTAILWSRESLHSNRWTANEDSLEPQ